MTGVLVVNAGSSSLKLRVLGADDSVTTALDLSPWDGTPDDPALRGFLRGLTGVAVAGHRVVHGGRRFTGPVLIDDDVVAGIGDLTDLAPLHQPRALAGIAATRAALPGVPGVACFDTAFHAGLPRGRCHLRAARRLGAPVRPAPVRLPRPVARIRRGPRRAAVR